MSTELLSIIDLIRFGGSRFNAAGLRRPSWSCMRCTCRTI
jgi:hypothetical protein